MHLQTVYVVIMPFNGRSVEQTGVNEAKRSHCQKWKSHISLEPETFLDRINGSNELNFGSNFGMLKIPS